MTSLDFKVKRSKVKVKNGQKSIDQNQIAPFRFAVKD